MASVMVALYGLWFILVGVKGNASEALASMAGETQFLYWIVVFLIITALWESPVGGAVAKPLAGLIILGFLLMNNNYQTIGAQFSALMSGLSSTSGTATGGVA